MLREKLKESYELHVGPLGRVYALSSNWKALKTHHDLRDNTP